MFQVSEPTFDGDVYSICKAGQDCSHASHPAERSSWILGMFLCPCTLYTCTNKLSLVHFISWSPLYKDSCLLSWKSWGSSSNMVFLRPLTQCLSRRNLRGLTLNVPNSPLVCTEGFGVIAALGLVMLYIVCMICCTRLVKPLRDQRGEMETVYQSPLSLQGEFTTLDNGLGETPAC